MDSRALINEQFDRAVEIIQSLPKTGPIQTGYEEKLTMYSLYKQATVGNVQSPRPGIWDVLGRAKWDAWAKHKDVESYEAKWLYVEALLKVLRRYSDKTVARDLVRELESYEGDPSHIMMSGSMSRSPGSDSSASDEEQPTSVSRSAHLPANPRSSVSALQGQQVIDEVTTEDETSDEEDEGHDHPLAPPPHESLPARGHSSHSSHNYRTPLDASLMTSPGLVPAIQPYPSFETPSAFADQPSTSARPSSSQAGTNYQPQYAHRRPPSAHGVRPYALQDVYTPRPGSTRTLERAVEGVQAHLAALSERLEVLESHSLHMGGHRSPLGRAGASGSPTYAGRSPQSNDVWDFDPDNMGLWSYVFRALTNILASSRSLSAFLSSNEARSPSFIIIRRLFLDISFIVSVLALAKAVWRRSGVRRREVGYALRALWWAIVGQRPPRVLVSRGV